MASNLYVLPDQAASAGSEAEILDGQIRHAIGEYNRSFAQLAYYGWRLKLADGFAALGYASEIAYMGSLGIGKTLWFQAVAVGQALSSLPLEELEKIPQAQALLLLSVKSELKTTYPWIKEAQNDTYRELARKVEERNRMAPGPERVPTAPLSFRVAATAKSTIMQKVVAFQEKHDLSSPGQALEFIVADRTQDTSALAELFEAIKLLNGVMMSLKFRDDLVEQRKWLSLAKGRVVGVYRRLLEASREEEDEVREEAVHAPEDTDGYEEDPGGFGEVPE